MEEEEIIREIISLKGLISEEKRIELWRKVYGRF